MKRLLKGGRVVDPANGRDGVFDILIDGDRIARVGKDLPVDGATVIEVPAGFVVTPGLFDMHVHLREPGQEHKETVATGTAVGGGRRLHGGRLHAEHHTDQRQRRCDRVHPSEGRAGGPRACLSHRRRVEGFERRSTRRHRRAARRRLRRDLRRRAAGEDRVADAPGARVRGHVQHAGTRALRRSVAEGRRRSARGVSRVDARPARYSWSRRGHHGAARYRAGGDDRRVRAHLPHERGDVAARGARGEAARRARHVRGGAAPLHADRRVAVDADELRHQHEDEPAAARGGRPRRHAQGHRRRQRRRDRDRPRAASLRREEDGVRPRAVRHRRASRRACQSASIGSCIQGSYGCHGSSSCCPPTPPASSTSPRVR